MKILKQGIHPGRFIAIITCGACECEFQVSRSECSHKPEFMDADELYSIHCPNCRYYHSLKPTDFKKPQPEDNDVIQS